MRYSALALSSNAGTSGAQFLKIGAGSRAGAMGDAYSALADDAYSLYYNPAGMVFMRDPQLAAAHTSYLQGSNYEVIGFAYPFAPQSTGETSRHALGIAIYNLSVSNIERRGTTETTDPVGNFGAGDYAYNLSYAYRVGDALGVGATGKMIRQTLDTYSASAWGADLGVRYTLAPGGIRPVNLALVARNMGTRPSYAGGISDPLPFGVTFGLGSELVPRRLRLETDVTSYRDAGAVLSVGGEYIHPWSEGLSGALRAGYSSQHKDIDGLTGVTFGLGLNFYRASFDFAWIPFGELGNTFRYSILVRFGKK